REALDVRRHQDHRLDLAVVDEVVEDVVERTLRGPGNLVVGREHVQRRVGLRAARVIARWRVHAEEVVPGGRRARRGGVGDAGQRTVWGVGRLPGEVLRAELGVGRHVDLAAPGRVGSGVDAGAGLVPRRVVRVDQLRAAGLGRGGAVDE